MTCVNVFKCASQMSMTAVDRLDWCDELNKQNRVVDDKICLCFSFLQSLKTYHFLLSL